MRAHSFIHYWESRSHKQKLSTTDQCLTPILLPKGVRKLLMPVKASRYQNYKENLWRARQDSNLGHLAPKASAL